MKSIYEILATKRDGQEVSSSEVEYLVKQYTSGAVEDYQMSAFLMAAFIRGLSAAETSALTSAMLRSGETVRIKGLDRQLIDKHSTGGVGDKLSLILSPLLAQCGIAVGMFSGRGLGHTGGTLDKLEAIPGMRVFHSTAEFGRLLKKHHWAITGQTERIAPADKKIYALRDASGTVESISLIVASIMSKKLALRSDGIVFDVKCGSGAFMKSGKQAIALARALLEVAKKSSLPARALVMDMNQPTGRMIGNILEVMEAVDVLKGTGSLDTLRSAEEIGCEMLAVGNAAKVRTDALRRMRSAISSGAAYESFCRYVADCGGDISAFEKPDKHLRRAHKRIVKSSRSGYISEIDTGRLGYLAVSLGAGRQSIRDKVDHLAGIELLAAYGAKIERGDPIAIGYAREKTRLGDFDQRYESCLLVTSRKPAPRKLVLKRLGDG